MIRQTLTPENKAAWLEMRAVDVTSTEVSALFGISPYTTEFELWHRKKSFNYVTIEETERMKWGSRLEATIAAGIAEDNSWTVRPFKEYMRVPDLKIGSSFDYMIVNREPNALLEIKNVDSMVFKDGWQVDEDGQLEAPPHIELQVQHQMLVSGLNEAYIGAMVGGNQIYLIHRTRSQAIADAIMDKTSLFWKSIEAGQAPSPDFKKDYAFIKELNGHAEPGSIITPTPRLDELAAQYRVTTAAIKDLTEKQDAIKAEVLTLMGVAEKCKGETYSISAGMVSETEINYTRKAYRNLKITPKKGQG